jgi:hypothetical protein
LGGWEFADHESATVVQSGVYWLGNGETETVEHTRGFRPSDIDRDAVLRAWKRSEWQVRFHVQRFMGIGTALVLNQGGWRTFRTTDRVLRLEPNGTKRKYHGVLDGRKRIRPDRGMVQTYPADISEQIERTGIDSTSIAVPWDAGGWIGSDWDVSMRAEHESVEGFE